MRANWLRLWNRRKTVKSNPATVPSGVVARVDDTGMVLLCTKRGLIYRVNQVGALIWNSVLQGQTQESIVDTISTRFGIDADEASQHVEGFVSSLVRNRLLCHPEYLRG